MEPNASSSGGVFLGTLEKSVDTLIEAQPPEGALSSAVDGSDHMEAPDGGLRAWLQGK